MLRGKELKGGQTPKDVDWQVVDDKEIGEGGSAETVVAA